MKSKIVRDLSDYEKVVWFDDVPETKVAFLFWAQTQISYKTLFGFKSNNLLNQGDLQFHSHVEYGLKKKLKKWSTCWTSLRDEIVIGNYPQNESPIIWYSRAYRENFRPSWNITGMEQWKQDKWRPLGRKTIPVGKQLMKSISNCFLYTNS